MGKLYSTKAFKNQRKVRSMAGPVKYNWNPSKSDKRKKPTRGPVGCDNLSGIDNVVTYVYNILPDGNHLAYVECDYVV